MKDNNKIVGMIAVKDYSHIALLFVDKKYQGRGIGKEILKEQLKTDENNKRNTILPVSYTHLKIVLHPFQMLPFRFLNHL